MSKPDTNELLNGKDLFGDVIKDAPKSPVAERFLIPPFSVLNARDGEWQERKRKWLALGIESEVGRGDNLLKFSDTLLDPDGSRGINKNRQPKLAPGGGGVGPNSCYMGMGRDQTGTSIFDPVLCELVYRWFLHDDGHVIDPFAGGSVRGILAHLLGRKYWGCDLRQEQVDANKEQAQVITPGNEPEWVCGDALDMLATAPDADLVFSCPPYGDLEVYSDNKLDLSNMKWSGFTRAYREIIKRAVGRLRQNRFACFVVGDFRDKENGHYRDFVSLTVDAFRQAGAALYNEMILVTSLGSLPIRITKQFEVSKKCGKTHQNVLVFIKGDARKAAEYVAGRKIAEKEFVGELDEQWRSNWWE